MANRELIVLGSAAAVPTRRRNHNGYVLRWNDRLLLFDPGDGIQRQFTLAGVAAARLTDICITHFHGDHCLGLPGIIQRLSGEGVERTIPIYYPKAGQEFFDRLRYASEYVPLTPIEPRPVSHDGPIGESGSATLSAMALDHRIPSFGYRLTEPDSRAFNATQLAAAGISGRAVGDLARDGYYDTGDRIVKVDEVTNERQGQSFALVMDTRFCDAAIELAQNVDLLVSESTFLESEADLAFEYGHMTAAQAARLAAEAGVQQLVLTHFSSRYEDAQLFLDEARPIFENVVVANDFDRVPVPPRPAA